MTYPRKFTAQERKNKGLPAKGRSAAEMERYIEQVELHASEMEQGYLKANRALEELRRLADDLRQSNVALRKTVLDASAELAQLRRAKKPGKPKKPRLKYAGVSDGQVIVQFVTH